MPSVDFSTRVAQYVKLRDLIKIKEKEFNDGIKKYKDALNSLNSLLLDHLNNVGANSVATDSGTVYRTEKKSASLVDPAAFMEYVITNGAWDLLDRKANITAVAAFMKENNTLPPGCNFNSAFIVGVRRPEQEKKDD